MALDKHPSPTIIFPDVYATLSAKTLANLKRLQIKIETNITLRASGETSEQKHIDWMRKANRLILTALGEPVTRWFHITEKLTFKSGFAKRAGGGRIKFIIGHATSSCTEKAAQGKFERGKPVVDPDENCRLDYEWARGWV